MNKDQKTNETDNPQKGTEYLDILKTKWDKKSNLGEEIQKKLNDIMSIRNRPFICYVSNVLNPIVMGNGSVSIDNSDDGPFMEMLRTIPEGKKNIDIILVTPGGSADSVDFFVKKLRQRFENIVFILPYMAMSAGTIFCLSGDEIIMTDSAFIGPIDPQVPSTDGRYVPAQSLFTLLNFFRERGINQLKKGLPPDWIDTEIIRRIDPKELGNAITASQLSTKLVTEYLFRYKFSNWIDKKGQKVSVADKQKRAKEIANLLCNNAEWLSHGSRITREIAVDKCKLKITHAEEIQNLDTSIKRFWALIQYAFESTSIAKIFASNNYFLVRDVFFQHK